MTKFRAIQRKTVRERNAERDKQRNRKAVAARRKAERSLWGGLTKREERKRAAQTDRARRIANGEQVRAEPVNVVRRSQRPPSWSVHSRGQRAEPSLPDGSAPVRPTTAAQVLANLYREGSPRSASASRPATLFSAENLALADVYARRFVEDAKRRARGERPIYPTLDEWRGHADNLLHVSGKKLRETSLTDLALGTLAAHRAAEIMAEAEIAA
jgi:hypothetical protein